jgi:DNA helicase-2/ATP-dependent DNA helicase PcrA
VDEYQDTNGAQLRMVKGLIRGHGNLCVVGDDDQSIYAWRGAVAGNILRFNEQFEGAQLISLTQNYRSTNNILRAANHVIRNNIERHDKALWSENGDGPLLRYERLPDDDTEAHWIATDLLASKRRFNLHWRDLAILYRTNIQSRTIEDAVRGAGIPYRIVGGQKFYDRKEVRDAVAYLRVIANPYDEAAWRRIINYPARGVGDVSVQHIADTAAATGEPFWLMVAEPERVEGLQPRVTRTLLALHDKIEAFRRRFAQEDLAEVCRDLVRSFGFADELVRTYKDSRQIQKRLENVKEVASGLRAFLDREPGARLEDFLARQSLDTRKEEPGSEDADEVSLMTLHGSKGLEFTAVWLCGLEEGLMPHQRVLDGEGQIDEERRLAYVGITRAKRHLTLTGADRRLRFGRVLRRRPSRFLMEIPGELIAGGHLGRTPQPTKKEQKLSARNAFANMLGALSDAD